MTTPYSSYGGPINAQITPSQSPTIPAHFTSVLNSASFEPSTPTAGRGKARGAATGAKRGRKPRGGAAATGASSPRPQFLTNTFSTSATPGSATPAPNANAQYPRVHWAMPSSGVGGGEEGAAGNVAGGPANVNGAEGRSTPAAQEHPTISQSTQPQDATNMPATPVIDPALMGVGGGGISSQRGTPQPDIAAGLILPGGSYAPPPAPLGKSATMDDEAEADDELLPAMADDDYSAQLSWQSQSKDNLKVLMDNLSPAQYDRFEAYRRHALPKQAVRKVIQQTLGQQVSQPVAQIIAGFSKVFVGEIVEKARAVQLRRGESGPLSPDHLREAYRAYQAETGHVGAARPLKAKKLFVR